MRAISWCRRRIVSRIWNRTGYTGRKNPICGKGKGLSVRSTDRNRKKGSKRREKGTNPIEHICIVKHFFETKHSIASAVYKWHVVCDVISWDVVAIESQRLLRHHFLWYCRNASITWRAGHMGGRACGCEDTWGIDAVENSTEHSGGVEGVDWGGAAGGPNGIGGAKGGYALDSVFWAERHLCLA